jgi:Ulp1 family protease
MRIDDDLVTYIDALSLQPNPNDLRVTHVLHRMNGLATQYFEPHDLHRFHSSNILSDNCINAGAALLQDHFSPTGDRAAILSTHDLHRVRYQARDDDLWRNTRRTTYWEKDVWILPIHRPQQKHWVLSVIYLRENRILLFDSFVNKNPWRADLQDILTLILRMAIIATRNGHQRHLNLNKFTAQPIVVRIFSLTTLSIC